MYGPGIPCEHWDLTGDGAFDLRDFAEFQNGIVQKEDGKIGYQTCCCNDMCDPVFCP
jgi:hypothetical protein